MGIPRDERAILEQDIRAALARDDFEHATELTLTHYGPEILRFLIHAQGHDEEAAEIYAQFCEDFWRGLPGFRGAATMRTWAFRLAHHARCRFLRDGWRKHGQRLDTEQLERLVQQTHSTRATWQQTELEQQLHRLRQELDADERTLLILRVDQRMSWAGIARVLAPDEAPTRVAGRLRTRFHRLITKIRRLARDQGLLGSSTDVP